MSFLPEWTDWAVTARPWQNGFATSLPARQMPAERMQRERTPVGRSSAQRALVSLRRVAELNRARPAVTAPTRPRALPARGGAIRLENVRFGYERGASEVLAGADLAIGLEPVAGLPPGDCLHGLWPDGTIIPCTYGTLDFFDE